MRKPEYRWRATTHEATLSPADPSAERSGSAAHDERFTLRRLVDDEPLSARFTLDAQWVDPAMVDDPDIVHAARCWLAARGRFRCNVQTTAGAVLSRGPFSVADLGTAPAGVAERLITLAPSNAEVADALGVFDRVVACEDSSDYPPQVRDLPRLGPDLGPDLDAVARLAPDLVLSSLTVPGMERIVIELRARGIAQLVLAPRSIADVLDDLRRVGAAVGASEQAEVVVARMQQQVADLRARQPASPVRIYLEWWPRPMFSPARDSYADELIGLAGGINVFGDRSGASVQVEAEALVDAAPELCFVSWCGVSEDKLDPRNLIERDGLGQLAAAQAGRVFALDEAFSGRPGPRMLEAARRMAQAIEDSGVRKP